jgi:hypothetical protein
MKELEYVVAVAWRVALLLYKAFIAIRNLLGHVSVYERRISSFTFVCLSFIFTLLGNVMCFFKCNCD